MSTIRAMVIEKTAQGMNGLGEKKFVTLPCVGELIEASDPQGIAQIYEVFAVVHDDDANGHDLFVRHRGTATSFRASLT